MHCNFCLNRKICYYTIKKKRRAVGESYHIEKHGIDRAFVLSGFSHLCAPLQRVGEYGGDVVGCQVDILLAG